MKKILLTAAALAALVAGPAFGADLSRPAPAYKAPPPPAPVYSWTGCYVGGGGGYGMWNQDITFLDPLNPPIADGIKSTAGGRGWFGTVQVGCDYQLSGDWVIGAFGDWDFGSITGDAELGNGGVVAREKQKWSWAAGARLGYVVMPNLLAYVSGGFTQAHFNAAELLDVDGDGPLGDHLAAQTYNGWFLGTGYEYALKWLPGFFWKTEYRWSEYEHRHVPFVRDSSGVAFNVGIDSHKFEQAIRSELVWRFNWASPVRAAY